jgi:hypothetical protein
MSGGLDIEIHENREHPYAVFFKWLRRAREERYASWKPGMGAEKRRAVLTIVQNEAVFLPIWLRYYSRFFAPDDIYVLDHESTDGSTSGSGFVRIPVTHETVDHTWMVRTIEAHQHELIERYDMVLATDVDEIVVPNPEWGTLGQYLDRFEEEWVNCLGYEILHLKDREGPLQLGRPILEQRGYWFANAAYDKPALATVPMTWEPGFHYLIHLHRMDYEICLARHRWRRERSWNQRDLTAGWAVHNRITEHEEFERWFYEDNSWLDEQYGAVKEGSSIVVEEIPAVWRNAL